MNIVLTALKHEKMKIENAKSTAHSIDLVAQGGLLREALELALKVIDNGEADNDLYFVAADLAHKQGNLDDAARLINQLLIRDPEHVSGWVLFGRIFAAQKDLVRASQGRSRAENLFPALTGMGICDDLPSAPAIGSRGRGHGSLSTEKLDFETMTFAEICVEQGYYNKALKIYNDLLAKDPGSDDIRARVADLAERLNRDD